MLRKRTRSIQKDQQMGHLTMSNSNSESYFQSDYLGHNNHKNTSLFRVPGLFVGLGPKGLSDSDSVRSPTSPLDFRVFSIRTPKSNIDGHQKSWDSTKVGLSIVDSLNDDTKDDTKVYGKILLSSDSKNILIGPQMRIKTPDYQTYTNSFDAPKSLPKNYAIFPHNHIKSPLHKGSSDVVFEIGETPLEHEPFGKIRSSSLDSCRSFSALSGLAVRKSNLSTSENFCLENGIQVNSPPQLIGGSLNSNNFLLTKLNSVSGSIDSSSGLLGSLSANEIELSEDYTCVISHGPNAKTTHIFGDCILKCDTNYLSNFSKNKEKEIKLDASSEIPPPYSSSDFLSFCYACKKKLEGEDIYMYRGEKAFCSLNCRAQEIPIDEETERIVDTSLEDSSKSEGGQELFKTGIFIAI